jgi:hypothetical protein
MFSKIRTVRVEHIHLSGSSTLIGNIRYSEIIGPTPEDVDQLPTARPIWNNISQYPTVNEIVHLVTGPKWDFNTKGKTKEYYLPPLNIMGSPNHNALAGQLSLIESTAGIETGEEGYFIENNRIKPLLPYEGDIMIEGRQGSSIRFGMTISGSYASPPWSHEINDGNIGRPITIIRNGQKELTEEETIPGTNHIIENINKDHSSIYLCSNQKISNFQKAGIGFKDYEPSYKHML